MADTNELAQVLANAVATKMHINASAIFAHDETADLIAQIVSDKNADIDAIDEMANYFVRTWEKTLEDKRQQKQERVDFVRDYWQTKTSTLS